MKFSVDKKIFGKFAGVEIGVLVIAGMDNTGHNEEILKLLRQEEKNQKEKLAGVELGTLPEIAIWRKIYKEFGSDPRDYRSSIEALLRRVRGGEKPLPQINNLVDLYNYLSLKYHLPAGAEDLDKVEGDIELTFSKGIEKGTYIGGDQKEDTCYKGEIIYKDNAGFICRRWNWREADRTKIDFETENSVLVIEKASGVTEEGLKQSLREAAELIKKHLKGKVQSFILHENSSFFETPFITGSKAKPTEVKKPLLLGRAIKPLRPTPEVPSLFASLVWEDENALSFKLKKIIYQAITKIGEKVKFSEVQLEHPTNENHGDYSANIALILAGKLKLNPRELAEKIASKLNEDLKKKPTMMEKVEMAGVGFLNLWLRQDYLITLIQLLKDKNGFKMTPLQGRKLMVEFTDPNPFKEFHIGHLYSNSVGESLSRLMEYCGATVARANYQGDVGMHVAKSIWGMMEKMENEKIEIKDLEERSLEERIKFLGEAYALGSTTYEEKVETKEEMKDINYLVFIAAQQYLAKKEGWQPQIDFRQYIHRRKKLARVGELFEKGRKWSLDYFETLYRRLGTKFDYYYFEGLVGEYGAKLVKEHLKDGIFEESKGAIVYRGEKYGLHTRVFINALGLPTYEAKELGLAPAKYEDFPYDLSLIVTGSEINEYFQVLLSALEEIKPELAKKTWHIGHGMVRLPQGKMSSRTGKVLTGEWLIDQAKLKIFEILKASKTKYTEEEKDTIAEKAAVAAVKYSLLKVSLPSDITFDLAKSVSLEGDSGPYLLYTYARCKSVLRKAKDLNSKLKTQNSKINYQLPTTNYQLNPEELALLRTLYKFPEVVIEATRTFSPNIICSFLFDLAQKYNLFYDKHSILHLGENELITTNFRLFLTFSTATIVKQGLYLLGIETVERM